VVFLNERAELGPRALGNRSILASAFSAAMKEVLNRVKQRESYRPVSPICLEEKAPAIFEPGNRDPYMLFDHKMKPEWREKLPAVCHLDGTARLQTINQHDNEIVANLLVAYEKLSDIAVLCNTSANYKGSGFFPDVYSATDWGAENGVHYVWCNQMLYTHNGFLASST
ncbi:MAG: hypothetical protein OEU26_28305, partial [Candidatus Tectomicrobia bacterium]|nr:hypothetical protein [Candidatus Tectomicrobia bacterium]